VKKTESGVTTYYVISSVLGSVLEVTSAGVQRAYVISGSAVVAQLNPNGSFYWLHLDHLGSGRKMTDTSGTMVYRAEFDPYGKLLYEWSSPTNLNTKKFTGYERDAATNLDYAQARMYASDWGRFMSPDPIGFKSANIKSPKSLNRYAYVNGDPVNLVDPTGLNAESPGGGVCFRFHYYNTFTEEGFWGRWTCLGGGGGNSTGADGGMVISGGGGSLDGRVGKKLPPCATNFLGQYRELHNVDIDKVNMYPGSLPSADITGILAMTIGNNIFFAPGKYNLTYDGIALIAHELYHVKQYNDVGGVGNFL
jgi:RHS repeat-associated protein